MLHPAADLDTPGPFRPTDLATDLADLGLRSGDLVMVHASIRSIGWVVGGGVGLLLALREVLGESGTVVVPTFTTYLNDPSTWVGRPVPDQWWHTVRDALPAFDPTLHACQPGMGKFPELVRTAGARRSAHPLYSLAALGPHGEQLFTGTELSYGLGQTSPLANFTASDGKVLLIGVGWDKCTVLHLSEHLTDYPGRRRHAIDVPVSTVAGKTVWRETEQLVMWEGDFAAVGTKVAAAGHARPGRVGAAPALLTAAKPLVAQANHQFAHRDLRAAALPPYMRDVTPAGTNPL
jgi:aminoglycoside 3-N-acetyltransferase